jgi:hypothetical protein
MALNSLNLYFGPSMPIEFESVGLAFIAAPNLRSDSAIGALSAIRYAKQNYDHIEESLTLFDQGSANSILDVSYNANRITAFTNVENLGLFSVNGAATLSDETWGPKILNSSIKVAGMRITPADTWTR